MLLPGPKAATNAATPILYPTLSRNCRRVPSLSLSLSRLFTHTHVQHSRIVSSLSLSFFLYLFPFCHIIRPSVARWTFLPRSKRFHLRSLVSSLHSRREIKKNGHLETRCNKARHRIDAAAYVRTYLSAPFFHPFIYLIRSSTKSPVVWLCVCVCVRAQTTTCLHRPWWGSFVMSSDVSVVSATFSTHQPTETFRGDRQKMMGENLEEKEKNWEEEEEE